MKTLARLALMLVGGCIIFYAAATAPKFVDSVSDPDVTVSGCVGADPVTVISKGDDTVISVNVGTVPIFTILVHPDETTHLVPDSWKNGEVDGYAHLPIVSAGEGSYLLQVPATDKVLYLSQVNVKCYNDSVNIMLVHRTFDWFPISFGEAAYAFLEMKG